MTYYLEALLVEPNGHCYVFLTVAKCNIVGRMFQQFNTRTGSMYNAVLVISRVANTHTTSWYV